jgi:inhibitor of KinA
MQQAAFHTCETIGDQGWLFRFVSDDAAAQWAGAVAYECWPWVEDIVPAYRTVAVLISAEHISLDDALMQLKLTGNRSQGQQPLTSYCHSIPVMYDGPDLALVAEETALSSDEVIRLHTSVAYRVYAIGFMPGFAYLGYLPEALGTIRRHASPRARVEPGSVGLAGRQTGIYPCASPGGWKLIGSTKVDLSVSVERPCNFRVGEIVRFTIAEPASG